MIYCKEVADVVCELVIDGYDLRQIGAVKGLPSKATLCRWLKDGRKIYFLDAYRRAKEIQHIIFADKVVDLAMQYGHRALGQLGGRVHKLHLRRNARARDWVDYQLEECHRLMYDADGKRVET
jgi:hypothetical protein